jgi:hypothetical protein
MAGRLGQHARGGVEDDDRAGWLGWRADGATQGAPEAGLGGQRRAGLKRPISVVGRTSGAGGSMGPSWRKEHMSMGLKRGAGAVQWGSADHERTQSSVFLYKSVHRFDKKPAGSGGFVRSNCMSGL